MERNYNEVNAKGIYIGEEECENIKPIFLEYNSLNNNNITIGKLGYGKSITL